MEAEKTPSDLYEQEEQCIKAIKTLRRAVFMRLTVAVLMIAAVAMTPDQPIVWGLMIFVQVINFAGSIPLIREWKKQKQLLNSLIAREEA